MNFGLTMMGVMFIMTTLIGMVVIYTMDNDTCKMVKQFKKLPQDNMNINKHHETLSKAVKMNEIFSFIIIIMLIVYIIFSIRAFSNA